MVLPCSLSTARSLWSQWCVTVLPSIFHCFTEVRARKFKYWSWKSPVQLHVKWDAVVHLYFVFLLVSLINEGLATPVEISNCYFAARFQMKFICCLGNKARCGTCLCILLNYVEQAEDKHRRLYSVKIHAVASQFVLLGKTNIVSLSFGFVWKWNQKLGI